MFATLTEASLPSASVPRLDLDALQSGPGNATEPPVGLVQRDTRIRLLHLNERQLRPRQAARGHGQAGEKRGGRHLLRGNPHSLGDAALGDPKRGMHQRRCLDLHGDTVRAGRVEAVQIHHLFEVEKQPLNAPVLGRGPSNDSM